MAKPKLPIPTESQEQEALCAWLRMKDIPFFAVPNGARVRPSQARKLKREGMTKGAPDIVLIRLAATPTGISYYKPVAVEMKRSKGGALSPEQKNLHERMRNNGWVVIVAKGAQDAINQLSGFARQWSNTLEVAAD